MSNIIRIFDLSKQLSGDLKLSKMKKVKIKGKWINVIPIKNRLGAVMYNATECDICFRIEGYYIEYKGRNIPIEETA